MDLDFYSLFNEYINPFTCPLKVLEDKVLDNAWMCCSFWFLYDMLMWYISAECGPDSVATITSYQDMILPQMRERCPGYAHNSMGCKVWLNLTVLTLIVSVVAFLWTLVVTVRWLRLRRQMQLSHGDYQTGVLTKLLPDQYTLEPQPLKSESNEIV